MIKFQNSAISYSTEVNSWGTLLFLTRDWKFEIGMEQHWGGPMDRILNWTVDHSANTLKWLDLHANQVAS